eukprot:INCI13960.1.p1 GENE.INCI13960.1~~INCI13960.1.p1  ORF type:complete len:613 (+),score=106.78 INCI13960.1:216-1841(+)
MWGMSPAMDLNELADKLKIKERSTDGDENPSASSSAPINILLIKPADVRSIVKTVTQRHRLKTKRPLHFYVWEETAELLARHLLLLQVFQEWKIPIRQRCNLWLEIFGNVLVQERTMHYIDAKGRQLVKLVCDQAGPLAGIVDTSLLKYRVIDALQTTFQSWRVKIPFNARELHEHRLRGLHKERFDFRKGAADWDYQYGLKEYGASIVHVKQYREWRESGIAFEFGDQTYTNPNRTMASYMLGKDKTEGLSKMVKGLWVDVVASPYISLGIDCHKPNKYARDLFHIVNKGHGTEQHRHNAVEVACYNMASFMYETETGKVYEMSREHEIFSGLGTVKEEEVIPEAAVADSSEPGKTASTDVEAGSVGGDEEEEEEDAGQDDEGNDTFDMGDSKKKVKKVFVDADVATSQEQALQRALNIASTWDGVKVFPLGGDGDPSTLTDVFRRARFDKLFDVVWVANLQVHHLTATPESKGVQACLAEPAAAVVVETLRHVPTIKKELKLGFLDKVEAMAEANGWTPTEQRQPGKPLDPECQLEQMT